MAECPKCKAEIGNAAYCGCGWGKRQKAGEHVPERRCDCCYEGCPNDATVRIKTRTGWANMCMDHYAIYHHLKAEEYCKSLVLDTMQKRRAWLTENARQIRLPPRKREPGDDDEVIAA